MHALPTCWLLSAHGSVEDEHVDPLSLSVGSGLAVREVRQASSGALTVHERDITVFLLGVAADSIARQKLAEWPGHAAFIPCGWCVFQGHHAAGSTAMRFGGYDSPAPQPLLGLGNRLVGDVALLVSDADQRQRAELVDQYNQRQQQPRGAQHDTAAGLSPQIAGCNGRSPIAHPLAYVSYNDLFMLPIYHTGAAQMAQRNIVLALTPHHSVGAQKYVAGHALEQHHVENSCDAQPNVCWSNSDLQSSLDSAREF